MKVKLLRENAKAPTRANSTDAGMDLFATENVVIEPHRHEFMGLGFACEIPEGYCGLIFARSGLGSKYGIRPRNAVGVVDSSYRNEVGVMLENHSPVPYMVREGDRVAQMVLVPILLESVEVVDELNLNHDRGGGFGSTGK